MFPSVYILGHEIILHCFSFFMKLEFDELSVHLSVIYTWYPDSSILSAPIQERQKR